MSEIPVRLYQKSGGGAYEAVEEVDVRKWYKKEGEIIQEGEPLVEIESSKATEVYPAPASGRLIKIRYAEEMTWMSDGTSETVNEVRYYNPPFAYIDVTPQVSAQEEILAPVTSPVELPIVKIVKEMPPKITPLAAKIMEDRIVDLDEVLALYPGLKRIGKSHVEHVLEKRKRIQCTPAVCAPPSHDIKELEDKAAPFIGEKTIVPLARALARDLGVDLETVSGSGPNGEIIVTDIEALQKQAIMPSVSAPAIAAEEDKEEIFLTVPRAWKVIAENLTRGAAIPTADAETALFHFGSVLDLYWKYRESFSFILWFPLFAAFGRVLAREEFILFNSWWDDAGKRIGARTSVHLGLSYDEGEPPRINWEKRTIEGNRLKVLTLHDAGKKSLTDVMRDTKQIIEKAREHRLAIADCTGFTAIFNNIGVLGHVRGRSILAGKISSMINLGAINFESRTGIVQIVFDHRLIDGAMTKHFARALEQEMNEHVVPELKKVLSTL